MRRKTQQRENELHFMSSKKNIKLTLLFIVDVVALFFRRIHWNTFNLLVELLIYYRLHLYFILWIMWTCFVLFVSLYSFFLLFRVVLLIVFSMRKVLFKQKDGVEAFPWNCCSICLFRCFSLCISIKEQKIDGIKFLQHLSPICS